MVVFGSIGTRVIVVGVVDVSDSKGDRSYVVVLLIHVQF